MNNIFKNSTSAYLALAFGVVCIACSAIFVKFAALPGPTSAFYRVLFAAAIAVPWWLWKRPSRPSVNAVILTLAGGVFFAIELVLWQVALLVTSAANATLLVNIAPVWVGLGALLVFREKLGSYFWGGLAVAFVGMVFVVSGGSKQLASFNYGDILAIGGSFFYALYLLVTQRVRAGMDTLTFLALSVTSSVVVLLITCLVLGSPLSGFSAQAWMSLAALGLFSHLSGYLAINYALGHLRASSVSVTLLGQPVITALLSIPLLGEWLSIQQIIGGAIVLVGVYLVNRRT
ncbi:MAG TPA: DMT family transporter [Anaerolineales bacterium]|nr:DMT family transporter [Anaerolineales bacterium]